MDALRSLHGTRLTREINTAVVLGFGEREHVVLVAAHAHVRVRSARPDVLAPAGHAPVQQSRRGLIPDYRLHHLAKNLDDVVPDLLVGHVGEALAERGSDVGDDGVRLAVGVHVDEAIPLVGAVQEANLRRPEAPLESKHDFVLHPHAEAGDRGALAVGQRRGERHVAALRSPL